MKYFATNARQFPEYNSKVKSGEVLDIPADLAASLNGVSPGILVPYDPAVHAPAPKAEEVTPVTPPPTPEGAAPSPPAATTPAADNQDAE